MNTRPKWWQVLRRFKLSLYQQFEEWQSYRNGVQCLYCHEIMEKQANFCTECGMSLHPAQYYAYGMPAWPRETHTEQVAIPDTTTSRITPLDNKTWSRIFEAVKAPPPFEVELRRWESRGLRPRDAAREVFKRQKVKQS